MVLRNEHLMALSVYSDLDSAEIQINGIYCLLPVLQVLGDPVRLTFLLKSCIKPLSLYYCSFSTAS